MLEDIYSEKKYLQSAVAGTVFAIAGFIISILFLDGKGFIFALLILIASRVLAWNSWSRLIKHKGNTLIPSFAMSIVAVIFIIWEYRINTMGFNVILMLFIIIAALESFVLAVMSSIPTNKSIYKPIASVFSFALLLYPVLMFLSGNVPFGP